MMISLNWDLTTLGRWPKLLALALVTLLPFAAAQSTKRPTSKKTTKRTTKTATKKSPPPPAPKPVRPLDGSLASIAQAYRESPTAVEKAAVVKYAATHAKQTEGGLAHLVLAAVALDRRQFDEITPHVQAARPLVPSLDDYCIWLLAYAQYGRRDYNSAVRTLDALWNFAPASPLVTRAVPLAAQSYIESGAGAEAVKLTRRHMAALAQPAGELLLAKSLESARDLIAAAVAYQNLYYQFPLSPESIEAESALNRLRASLGASYPPSMPQLLLARAQKLIEKQPRKARGEIEQMIPVLGGAEREIARVRLGGADYHARETARAGSYLRALTVSDPEASAERLYYLSALARRLDQTDELTSLLDQLARQHRQSPWRLEALIGAGYYYAVMNRPDLSEAAYRACADDFPNDPRTAVCHWKVTWSAYLRRRPEAADLLRTHLQRFPGSDKANAALYFLGRLAEGENDPAAARAYYAEIVRRFPNSYYALIGKQRLSGVRQGGASSGTVQFLSSVSFPERQTTYDMQPHAASVIRLQRARLLETAGLDDWVESEMRFAAKTEKQPAVFAMELAEHMARRGTPDKGIRYIKNLVPDYLYIPIEITDARFWRLAFPMPYREPLERYAEQYSLDPYLVAALIRQESEFNPRVVSRANAYGLTQVLPSTGRYLSRKVGMKTFTTSMLYQPEVNLHLGTYYLRTMLNTLNNKVEETLAAYNAGKSRVDKWVTWGEYREPVEFIENIPFTETREYVQIVLRNASVYRFLYANKAAAVPSTNEPNRNKQNAGAPARNQEPARPLPKRKNG